jgi:ParB-like chromosome segregation protein Spo0J
VQVAKEKKARKRAPKADAQAATPGRNHQVLDELAVVYVPIDSIKPNPYNPNRQSEHDFTLLCKSIAADGFTQPVIVNEISNEIVDGEHRWRACKALGFTEVPVVLTQMTPEQMRISTLRHNRARGKENTDLVVDLYKELQTLGNTDEILSELMLDPVELERMSQLDGDELSRVSLDVTEAELGPDGHGLTANDKATGIDTTADERRAREKQLERIKADEEVRMGSGDNDVLRIQLIYTGDTAALVKRVIDRLKREGDSEPVPAAIKRLCAWWQSTGAPTQGAQS